MHSSRISPFEYSRLEFERDTILWMDDRLIGWSSPKSQLFWGTRGSGKTSVLKALSWQLTFSCSDMVINGSPKLQSYLKHPKHIGVYFKIPEMDINLWERWGINSQLKDELFSTYIEYLVLDLFFDAFSNLRQNDSRLQLFNSRTAEDEFIRDFTIICFPREDTRPVLKEYTFDELRRYFSDCHRIIKDIVLYNEVKKTEIDNSIRNRFSISSLVREMGLCLPQHFANLSPFSFLILLDDCHVLKRWQKILINSAIRKAAAPFAFKLSSLLYLYDEFGTNIPNHRLTTYDLERINQGEDFNSKTNIHFLEGICRTRIKKYGVADEPSEFTLSKILGDNIDINNELIQKLNISEDDEAKSFYKLFKAKYGNKGYIMDAWLQEKQVRPFKLSNKNKLRRRQIDTQYFRKYRHVAAVALCKSFAFDFPYAGLKILLFLCDGSVREFLRFMHFIFLESNIPIEKFISVKKPLPIKIQTTAIKKAADDKYYTIEYQMGHLGAKIKLFCNNLGKLFSQCQSYPYLIKSPETASIIVQWEQIDITTKSFIKTLTKDLINEAFLFGAISIKLKPPNNKFIVNEIIGLHPALAPYYNISYRSIDYYPQRVTPSQLDSLLSQDKTSKTIKKILDSRINNKYSKLQNGSKTKQLSLLESKE